MSVTFLDPRAEPGAPVEAYALSADPDAPGFTVGLLANGFPDSVAFLDQVEAALRDVLPHASFRRWDKGDASSEARKINAAGWLQKPFTPEELLDTITAF